MAANGALDKIESFLRELLELLQTKALSKNSEGECHVFEQRLFEKFVGFQRTRIKKYWRLLHKPIEIELRKAQLSREVRGQLDADGSL